MNSEVDSMKKIIFVDIPMREMNENRDKQCYNRKENINCDDTSDVFFPINAVLAKIMNRYDTIKIVLLATVFKENHTLENIELFKNEVENINARIGAKLEYEVITTEFVESKKKHEVRLCSMLSVIEKNAELYADITFGQKTLPMLLMCAFHFAERFFDADIKKIIYGKVEFIKHSDGNTYPENPELYDVTLLYYLNNLIASMQASSSEKAVELLDAFFSL